VPALPSPAPRSRWRRQGVSDASAATRAFLLWPAAAASSRCLGCSGLRLERFFPESPPESSSSKRGSEVLGPPAMAPDKPDIRASSTARASRVHEPTRRGQAAMIKTERKPTSRDLQCDTTRTIPALKEKGRRRRGMDNKKKPLQHQLAGGPRALKVFDCDELSTY